MIEILRVHPRMLFLQGNNRRVYICKCHCGNEFPVAISAIHSITRAPKSCGSCYTPRSLPKGMFVTVAEGARKIIKDVKDFQYLPKGRNGEELGVRVISDEEGKAILKDEREFEERYIKDDGSWDWYNSINEGADKLKADALKAQEKDIVPRSTVTFGDKEVIVKEIIPDDPWKDL